MPLVESTTTYAPRPQEIAASQLTSFTRFCERETGRVFRDYAALHAFSVENIEDFWGLLLRWSGLRVDGAAEPVCTDVQSCERALFFPNCSLSYVDNVLRVDSAHDASRPAVVAYHEYGPPDRLTRGELRARVQAVAEQLRKLGAAPGDRVVAVARNNAEAVVAALAAAAVGATYSSVSTDMGAPTILSRFEQLQPVLLMSTLSLGEGPSSVLTGEGLTDLVRGLPSVRAVVALDDGPVPAAMTVPVHRLASAGAAGERRGESSAAFPRFPFNHPLFVLFTSGTTGAPKCIVHGAGGTLLEHVKEHRLHVDLRPTDRLFFQTSVSWMMWNWQLSALASGATIVLYDGPVTGPETLWRIAAAEKVTVFGTSPPYLKLAADEGYSPRADVALSALRAVLSTGSVLRDSQYDWVREHVGEVPLQSVSGGTDIIGCFVLGNPNLPVTRGYIQCRGLGLDVRAVPADAPPVEVGIGELVCAAPFPSRPLGFVGDPDGRRFHEAYFSQHAGVWTHGDLIEIAPSGEVRMHGRSDGVLNVNGQRIGPAEIYRVLQGIDEIREAMAVQQDTPHGRDPSRIVLLVVMCRPGTLDARVAGEIRRLLAQRASAAHVPRLIVEVDELPHTHSGKASEAAARCAVNSAAVANRAALRNPASVDAIAAAVAEAGRRAQRGGSSDAAVGESTEARLRAVWEEVLELSPIGPDDNFFEIGGTSLLAVRLIYGVQVRLGVELAPSALILAPTVASMAAMLEAGATGNDQLVIPIRTGQAKRPVFVVHGLSGDHLEVQALLTRLDTDRPIYGVRASPDGHRPARVEDMAAEYVRHIRMVQPHGPYALMGYSFGGLVSYEMARLLNAAGEDVESLVLVDSYAHRSSLPTVLQLWFQLLRLFHLARHTFRSPREQLPWLVRRVTAKYAPRVYRMPPPRLPPRVQSYVQSNRAAYHGYRPGPYAGRAVYIRAAGRLPLVLDPLPIWSRMVEGGLVVERVPGNHREILHDPHLQTLVERIAKHLPDGA